MKTSTTYKGTLNGVYGFWCGFCPEGVEVQEEVTVYQPDEGKVFMKDNEEYSCVILKDGDSIDNYTEVDMPEPALEPAPTPPTIEG